MQEKEGRRLIPISSSATEISTNSNPEVTHKLHLQHWQSTDWALAEQLITMLFVIIIFVESEIKITLQHDFSVYIHQKICLKQVQWVHMQQICLVPNNPCTHNYFFLLFFFTKATSNRIGKSYDLELPYCLTNKWLIREIQSSRE